MDSSSRGGGGSGSRSRGRSPRQERPNAAKHIDYEAGAGASSMSTCASWSSSSVERSLGLRPSRSLDLATGDSGTDFCISGSGEGEIDELCRSVGLSGPDKFAIPIAAWEARKARSNSDLLPRSRLVSSPPVGDPSSVARSVSAPEV